MTNLNLDISLLLIIGIVIIGKFLNEKLKIPLVHSLIVLTYVIHSFGWLSLFDSENILQAFFLLIPIILMNDVFHLKFNDVKKYKKEIFLLAFVGIIISVLITAGITYSINSLGIGITFGAYLAIATILTATDAISVSNIFSQFKSLSHKDKVLVEGDSLGNDGTTIVLFYFIALPWMLSGTFDFQLIPLIAIKVFMVSSGIGLVIGYLGYLLLKQFSERYTEFLITVGTVYLAFVIAEWMHVAGVFALIISGMTLSTLILKDISLEKKNIANEAHEKNNSYFKNLKIFRKLASTEETHKETVSLIRDFGFIAVTILFVALSEIIEPNLLVKYWKEILIFFIVSSFSRGFTIYLFGLSSYIFKIKRINFNSWLILTLAGIKGGLSIVMVYSIPETFPLLEMFKAIVMGIILLSVFSYGIGLLGYMMYKEKHIN